MATLRLTDLLSQRAELEKKIADAQRNERADAIAQVRRLIADYGLSAADLMGKATAAKGRSGAKEPKTRMKQAGKAVFTSAAKPSRKGANAGKKVAAKYRDASTGQTWSGRGLRPNWLKAALAAGRPMSEFAL